MLEKRGPLKVTSLSFIQNVSDAAKSPVSLNQPPHFRVPINKARLLSGQCSAVELHGMDGAGVSVSYKRRANIFDTETPDPGKNKRNERSMW